MKPERNQINGMMHELLGKEICVESGMIYDFTDERMCYLPNYYEDRNLLPQMTELLSFAQEKEYVKFMAQRFHVSVSGPEHFWPSHVVVDMIEAPMSWHVEAILRALGKWPKEWGV